MCPTKTKWDPHVCGSINAETASKDNKFNFHGLTGVTFILPENAQFSFLLKGEILAMERLKPHARTVFLELHFKGLALACFHALVYPARARFNAGLERSKSLLQMTKMVGGNRNALKNSPLWTQATSLATLSMQCSLWLRSRDNFHRRREMHSSW